MITVDGHTIHVPRGDTGVLYFDIENIEEYSAGKIYFTVKRYRRANTAALIELPIEIEGEDAFIKLKSRHTTLEFGDYWWDLRFHSESGDVDTLMDPAEFCIDDVVGNTEVMIE